jgi:site-specific recombinase XerD
MASEIALTDSDPFEKFLRLSVSDGDARPRTVRAYREAIGYYAAWAGSVTVNPATAGHEQILAYRESLIAAGYARATIRLRLTAVRLFYRALARWGGRRTTPPTACARRVSRETPSSAAR